MLHQVSSWKGMIRFGNQGKWNPRYTGTFKVLSRIGPVAYHLELPQELSGIYDSLEIMGCEVKGLKHSRIPTVKIRWNSQRGFEFTWKRKYKIKRKYPHLFSSAHHWLRRTKSRDEILSNGGMM
ncbi:hypothetical protein Tco_1404109 [Tanacetum coccineum]